MKKINNNFLIFMVFLTCLSLGQVSLASQNAEEEKVDGRPDYLRLGPGSYYKDEKGNKTYLESPVLSEGAYSLLSNDTSPGRSQKFISYIWRIPEFQWNENLYDFQGQHQHLIQFFQKPGSPNKRVDLSCFSRKTENNPPVILWLHGSGGPDDYIPFLEKLLKEGLAYVSFPRFSSHTEKLSDRFFEGYYSIWEGQDTLSLFSEIAIVYGVCQKLVEHGTEKIILAGHSRGGILALTCAMEEYAQYFRKIVVGDHVGSVVGYVPVSALPLIDLPNGLTQQEPVGVFHGVKDNICSYDAMKGYMSAQTDKKNITFFEEDFGHKLWERIEGGFKGMLRVGLRDLWHYKFSPKKWFTHTGGNFWTQMRAIFQRDPGYIRHTREDAQNFNQACVRIGEGWKTFTPLQEPDQHMDIEELPQFIQSRVTKGFEGEEKISRQEQEDALMEKIIDFMSGIQKG